MHFFFTIFGMCFPSPHSLTFPLPLFAFFIFHFVLANMELGDRGKEENKEQSGGK